MEVLVSHRIGWICSCTEGVCVSFYRKLKALVIGKDDTLHKIRTEDWKLNEIKDMS